MFLRLVAESFSRRLSRKLLTAGALALGMAVATAALSVSLDVGDRLAREFRSLGANLIVTPAADSLPLEIGGVDYRPVNAGAYLPEADLGKLKTIFWRNNIVGFAPALEAPVLAAVQPLPLTVTYRVTPNATLIGTWASHLLSSPDGQKFSTGVESTNPWWQVEGRWFAEGAEECIVGRNFAQKNKLQIGSSVFLYREWAHESHVLRVTGILSTGGPEDDAVIAPLDFVQQFAGKPGQYRKLYVSALTKPEDDFGRRDPKSFTPTEYDRWFCTPYISSIALQIQQVLPGTDVRVIRRVAEGEGRILTRVRNLLWLVTVAALLAAALAVGATSAATVLERRTEIALMKALGAGRAIVKGLFAAEQIVLGLVGGATGYALGILLARLLGQIVFGVAPAPSALIFAAVLALAIGVTLAGSALSLRRAARVEPAPILRGE
jgi:putative ABC transport system permease protein